MKHIDIHTRIVVTGDGIEIVRDQQPEQSKTNCSHSPDFATVIWDNQEFYLTGKQRTIVALMMKSLEQGHRFLSGAYLLDEAGSDSTMGQLFRNNPAWGGLVCQGVLHGGPDGTYCLRPLAA